MSSYSKTINDLIKKNISISIAESFTGGQIIKTLTDIPGISKVFNMGLVTYSNESKKLLLGISFSIINKYGAVSEEVSKLMSKNLSKISKSDLSISTTGIAGPSGATKNKPIGLIFITFTFKKKTYTFKKKLYGSRSKIQKDAVDLCFKEIKKLI